MPGGYIPQEDERNRELVRRQRHDGIRDLAEPKPILILGNQVADPPDAINGWMPHEFDYPCMIQIIGDGQGTFLGQSGVVFAQQYRQRDAFEDSAGLPAIRSRGGKLWIPAPGKWYLQYVPADNSADRRLFGIVYDNTGGAMETERRFKHVGLPDDVITVTSGVALNLGIGDMTPQTCDGQIIQNIGANDIWWKRGRAADNAAAVGDGGVIPPRGTLELVGDLAYPWTINARAAVANTDVYFLKVVS